VTALGAIGQDEDGRFVRFYTRMQLLWLLVIAGASCGFSPNEKKNEPTNETATGKKGNKVRKSETVCETTYRKAKKKIKQDPDQCNSKKENVNKTL
jgi:hypothetical protein